MLSHSEIQELGNNWIALGAKVSEAVPTLTERDQESLRLLTGMYQIVLPIGGGCYAALMPLAYTCAIIVGQLEDRAGYSNRWCYSGGWEEALDALIAWGGRGFEGEPEGWIRHPPSGRRRQYDADRNIVREWVCD